MLSDLLKQVYRVELFYKQKKSVIESETKRVEVAKYRLDHSEEVKEVLDILQDKITKRSVATLETLMSAFVSDVLPENPREIKARVSTLHGVPSLNLYSSQDGNRESIMRGSGGSLTNIVCCGLRMTALVKSHARPFMIVDEGDCWLEPDRVDAFYSVLFAVVKKLDIQLLVITHHDFSLLKHLGAWDVELYQQGATLKARHGEISEFNKGHVKSVCLKNYMSHSDTHIPFHPEITVIWGKNHIGKSVVADAFRSVCYGEGEEEVISHGKSSCSVEIVTPDGLLVWTRARKGTPIEKYSLYKNSVLINEGPGLRGSVPEFVSSFLQMEKKDGLDIHFNNQKKPLFMLEMTGSQQAAILSIGEEASYVPQMLESYKKICKDDKTTVKVGEDIIQTLTRSVIIPLEWAKDASIIENKVKDIESRLEKSNIEVDELTQILQHVSKCKKFLDQVEKLSPVKIASFESITNEAERVFECLKLRHFTAMVRKIAPMDDRRQDYSWEISSHFSSFFQCMKSKYIFDVLKPLSPVQFSGNGFNFDVSKSAPDLLAFLKNKHIVTTLAHLKPFQLDKDHFSNNEELLRLTKKLLNIVIFQSNCKRIDDRIDVDRIAEAFGYAKDVSRTCQDVFLNYEIICGAKKIVARPMKSLERVEEMGRCLENIYKALNEQFGSREEILRLEKLMLEARAGMDAVLRQTGGKCPTCKNFLVETS